MGRAAPAAIRRDAVPPADFAGMMGGKRVVPMRGHARHHRGFTLVELPAVSRRKREAFTLVELLVVVGIIAILNALLMPGLSAARRQGRAVTCLSNLRQLGMAFQMYCNENKGRCFQYVDASSTDLWIPLL